MKEELKEKNINTKVESKVVDKEVDVDLEIIEIEEKIAPRNWNVYALL